MNHRRTRTENTEYQSKTISDKNSSFRSRKKVIEHNRRYQSEINEFPERNILHQHNLQSLSRQKGLVSQQRQKIAYNKWYIKPEIRMKKPLKTSTSRQGLDIDFAYNRLYEEVSVKDNSPFEVLKNEKLFLLQKIPTNNMKLLESFKKNREAARKRVPKIVELFLRKKNVNENRNMV